MYFYLVAEIPQLGVDKPLPGLGLLAGLFEFNVKRAATRNQEHPVWPP
jgi:hypothetical protein